MRALARPFLAYHAIERIWKNVKNDAELLSGIQRTAR
jgi:hypothetical protein